MKKAFIKSFLSFISLSPIILGIIGLVAIFQTFVNLKSISHFFKHGAFLNVITGTFFGAIGSGNGVIGYVIADGFQKQGIGDYALISFILAWTTLSIVNLPAEASVFGVKFTTYRNILTLFCTIIISFLSVWTTRILF